MNNDTIFKSTISITTVMETEILPLSVRLKIGLGFSDADPYHQAIALERIRYVINIMFNDSIFGSRTNDLVHVLKSLTTTPVVECWDEPWDQFLAIMVYYKVTAILENVGYVDSISISGDTINEDLEYMYFAEQLDSAVLDDDIAWMKEHKLESLWYHRSDTTVNEDMKDPSAFSWKTLGLTWDKPAPNNQIVVTGGSNVKPFTPKIIK